MDDKLNIYRRSKCYSWSILSELGHGVSGKVYRGMHMTTGEAVAIKVFQSKDDQDPKVKKEVKALSDKEVNMLKKLQHKNIVRLLAQETELSTGRNVMVTELCIGGNMLVCLQMPENAFGLKETEFLAVFSDLLEGLQYLREHSIIHRDIKPGNIVKSIGNDGSVVYKLIDFGSARVLMEHETYESIYGTKEYLHPYILLNYLAKFVEVKNLSLKAFKAFFELWTIGATLYNFATGSVPFKVYHSNAHFYQNGQFMCDMITGKAADVISAVEHQPGTITYSKDLPETCFLNSGLKMSITIILRKLLEHHEDKIWNFEEFFEEAKKILSQLSVHIFYVNESKPITLTLSPDAKLADLKREITEQLNICESDQLLLFHNTSLDSIINPSMKIQQYPITSPSQPIVLIHSKNMSLSFTMKNDEQNQAKLNGPFSCNDMNTGWMNCCIGYYFQRDIQNCFNYCSILLNLPSSLLCYSNQNVQKLINEVTLLEQRKNDLHKRIEALDNSFKLLKKCQSCNDYADIDMVITELKKKETEINEALAFLEIFKQCSSQLHASKVQWEKMSKNFVVRWLENDVKKIEKFINDNECCFEEMKATHTLKTRNERLEKAWAELSQQPFRSQKKRVRNPRTNVLLNKIFQNMKSMGTLQNKMRFSRENILHVVNQWYRGMFTVMCSCNDVEKALRPSNKTSMAGLLESHSLNIDEAEKQFNGFIQSVLSNCSTPDSMNSIEVLSLPPTIPKIAPLIENQANKKSNTTKLKEVESKLKEVNSTRSNLWNLLEENDSLLEKIRYLRDIMNSKMKKDDATEEKKDEK